jgi:hypothetical protein
MRHGDAWGNETFDPAGHDGYADAQPQPWTARSNAPNKSTGSHRFLNANGHLIYGYTWNPDGIDMTP